MSAIFLGNENVTSADLEPTSAQRFERYREALVTLPPSGGGGCHTAILRVARLGQFAAIGQDQIASDLAAHVHGKRTVKPSEIWDAIRKVFNSPPSFGARRHRRVSVDGAALVKAILELGNGFTENDLLKASPIRLEWSPVEYAPRILRLLYEPDDYVFIGDRYDGAENVRYVEDWLELFESGRRPGPHIIPNPLTGRPGKTQEGEPSYRADSCVAQFKFATVEFDDKPLEWQLRFWAGVKLPVVALISSGGKSIHGWIKIEGIENREDWTEHIEGSLFDILTDLGVDGSCKNEARLSRMPGHFRSEKQEWQRLLYLAPEGKPVLA